MNGNEEVIGPCAHVKHVHNDTFVRFERKCLTGVSTATAANRRHQQCVKDAGKVITRTISAESYFACVCLRVCNRKAADAGGPALGSLLY